MVISIQVWKSALSNLLINSLPIKAEQTRVKFYRKDLLELLVEKIIEKVISMFEYPNYYI